MAQRLVSRDQRKFNGEITFEQGNKVSFNSFLKGSDGRRLESEIRLEVLRDFANETLEGKLADQKFSRLLVSTDFTKCDGTRAVTMGLLDASRSETS